jgi:hypothetical protein
MRPDGRPSRRPWRGRRSDDHQLQAVLGPALERPRRTFTNRTEITVDGEVLTA